MASNSDRIAEGLTKAFERVVGDRDPTEHDIAVVEEILNRAMIEAGVAPPERIRLKWQGGRNIAVGFVSEFEGRDE